MLSHIDTNNNVPSCKINHYRQELFIPGRHNLQRENMSQDVKKLTDDMRERGKACEGVPSPGHQGGGGAGVTSVQMQIPAVPRFIGLIVSD